MWKRLNCFGEWNGVGEHSEPSSVMSFIQAGRLGAVAFGGNRRLALFPSRPTLAKSGYPSLGSGSLYHLAVPAKTSSAIHKRLAAARSTPKRRKLTVKQDVNLINPHRVTTLNLVNGWQAGVCLRHAVSVVVRPPTHSSV